MTVDELIALTKAGYTKEEILAITGTESKEVTTPPEAKKPAEAKKPTGKESNQSFAKILESIADRMSKIEEAIAKREPEQTEQQGADSNEIINILQRMNLATQKYDLPPQHNVAESLEKHLVSLMEGDKKEENR